MSRLSQRVSAMWSTVKCPRCETVVPVSQATAMPSAPPPSQAAGDKRWSFIWLAPRGDFCPECDFPLSKYFGRIKWIRLAMIGVGLVFLGLVLQIFGVLAQYEPGYFTVMKAVLNTGVGIFAIGMAGVVVGGRR